jgi:hypothetical protein
MLSSVEGRAQRPTHHASTGLSMTAFLRDAETPSSPSRGKESHQALAFDLKILIKKPSPLERVG